MAMLVVAMLVLDGLVLMSLGSELLLHLSRSSLSLESCLGAALIGHWPTHFGW